MDKHEGARRITMLVKFIMLIGLTVGVALGMTFGMILGIMSSVYIIAFGGIVWAAGWIIQGFNRPNS
jgi:hypothetical protein